MNDIYNNCDIPSDETIIWRYMDTMKFISLLIEQKLFFCRMDKLTDQYEGTVPFLNMEREYLRIRNIDFMSHQQAETIFNKSMNSIIEFKKFTLLNCWTIDDKESFALWKIYLNNDDKGIAIKSTVKRLKNCFSNSAENIKFVRVKYLDFENEDIPAIQQRHISTIKNKYYEYEKELRAILLNQYDRKTREPLYESGKNISVNLNTLIEDIYISPMAPNWYINLIANIISSVSSNKNYRLNAKLMVSLIKDKL